MYSKIVSILRMQMAFPNNTLTTLFAKNESYMIKL